MRKHSCPLCAAEAAHDFAQHRSDEQFDLTRKFLMEVAQALMADGSVDVARTLLRNMDDPQIRKGSLKSVIARVKELHGDFTNA